VEAEHEIVNIGQGAGQLRRPRQTRRFASPGRSDQPRYGTLWKSLRSAEDGATHISCCRRALARNCCDDRNALAAERTVSLQTAVLCSETRLGVHALVVASYSSAVISDSASAGSDS
jgi:hypothetical protein